MKKTILILTLVFFGGVNVYALAFSGLEGLSEFFATANGWTELFVIDLVIALGLACAWMIGDARRRGRSATPYVLLTMATGSIGPLVYLLNRD